MSMFCLIQRSEGPINLIITKSKLKINTELVNNNKIKHIPCSETSSIKKLSFVPKQSCKTIINANFDAYLLSYFSTSGFMPIYCETKCTPGSE